MNLQDIANLASTLGNIAVVVTLLFALRQLRVAGAQANESRSANRLVLWTGVQNQALEFYKFLAASDVADLYARGRKDPTTLNEIEQKRFFYLCVSWFTIQENIFEAARSGYLPDTFIEGWTAAFDDDLKDAGFCWFWKMEGNFFDPNFQQRVTTCIASHANTSKLP